MTKLDALQSILLNVDGNDFHAPAKRMYQTFHRSKNIKVYRSGKQIPAKFDCLKEKIPFKKIITKGNRTLYIAEDGIVFIGDKPKIIRDLQIGEMLKIEKDSEDGYDEIASIEEYEQSSDYTFTLGGTESYITFDGIIICN